MADQNRRAKHLRACFDEPDGDDDEIFAEDDNKMMVKMLRKG